MKYKNPTVIGRLRRRWKLVVYLLSVIVVVTVQTGLYWWGMAALEGDPRSLLDSFGIVVQSLTTTGYGQDAPWDSAFLQTLIIVIQFTGIAYIFIAFPLFIVPWLRTAFLEPTVPDAIRNIKDHILITGYTPLSSTLVEDLEGRDQSYVVVESDEERAREAYESDTVVVVGDMTTEETLRNVNGHEARAAVVDTREISGIETILTIREFNSEMEIVCPIEEPKYSQYLRYAGATTVISPKHRLGKSLADKAQNTVTMDFEGAKNLDASIEIAEFPVARNSDIYGRSPDDLIKIREMDVSVIGAWIRGEFVTSLSPADHLDDNSLLVLAGTEAQLERVSEIIGSEGRIPTTGRVVIAGYGLTGMTADGILRKVGRSTTVIDIEQNDGVDVVGDATKAETLHEAGVADAEIVILTLPDDEAILTTLVAREINEDAEIIVAPTEDDSTSEFFSAGANCVFTLPKVTNRMTTLELFENDVMGLCEQIQLRQLDIPTADSDFSNNEEIREGTGATVVAVRRDNEIDFAINDRIEFDDNTQIIVAGTEESIKKLDDELSVE